MTPSYVVLCFPVQVCRLGASINSTNFDNFIKIHFFPDFLCDFFPPDFLFSKYFAFLRRVNDLCFNPTWLENTVEDSSPWKRTRSWFVSHQDASRRRVGYTRGPGGRAAPASPWDPPTWCPSVPVRAVLVVPRHREIHTRGHGRLLDVTLTPRRKPPRVQPQTTMLLHSSCRGKVQIQQKNPKPSSSAGSWERS